MPRTRHDGTDGEDATSRRTAPGEGSGAAENAYAAAMIDLDPFALAARQLDLDQRATAQLPALLDRKKARLARSPHAFLRGTAPLFYEILAARPDLAQGPADPGFIVGDMHLENLGAYRNEADDVVFALNDFDDAAVAPLSLDVLRLSTSVLLAGRGFGCTGAESMVNVRHVVGAYLKALAGGAAPATPELVAELMLKVRDRNRKTLLDERAPVDAHGRRRFLRGPRYLDLPPSIEGRLPALLAAYVAALGPGARGHAGEWKVEDAAQRVAGTGSLGVRRVALLVRDHGGEERLLELKECHASAVEVLGSPAHRTYAHPAARVVEAASALLASPPRHLAAIELDGLSFAGRRLFPQEDKLAVDGLRAGPELDSLLALVGHLLGAAHLRGLSILGAPAPRAWTSAEISAVIDHAVALGGLMEAVYLAWSRRCL